MGQSVGQEVSRGTKRSHSSPGVTKLEDPQNFLPEGRVFLRSIENPRHCCFPCCVRLSPRALTEEVLLFHSFLRPYQHTPDHLLDHRKEQMWGKTKPPKFPSPPFAQKLNWEPGGDGAHL